MYPLIEFGPLRLSSGGLVVLIALFGGSWLAGRIATWRGGSALAEQLERCFYPALLGAIVGGRLWYGLFNLDLYGRQPLQFLALSFGNMAWPGALLGSALAGWLWCRWRGLPAAALADCVALALPFALALGYTGMLLSGEVFGMPTSLPWGITMLGAARHPTQLYYALAALGSGALIWRQMQRTLPIGSLAAIYAALQGLSVLLIEPLRADSLLLPAGIRVAQIAGLAMLLAAIAWARQQSLQQARTSQLPYPEITQEG